LGKVYKDVRGTDYSLSYWDLEGKPDVVIKRLEQAVAVHTAQGHTNLIFNIDYDQYDGIEYTLEYTRPETERERDSRLIAATKRRASAAKLTAANEEKERAMYDKLKKKYE
jgi:hypothetical protein